MDRMATDYRAASEELGQQRRLAAAWEAQAQVFTGEHNPKGNWPPTAAANLQPE